MQITAIRRYKKDALEKYICREKVLLDNLGLDFPRVIKGFRDRGCNYAVLANIYGVNRSTVMRWAREHTKPKDATAIIQLISIFNKLVEQEQKQVQGEINDDK